MMTSCHRRARLSADAMRCCKMTFFMCGYWGICAGRVILRGSSSDMVPMWCGYCFCMLEQWCGMLCHPASKATLVRVLLDDIKPWQ